MPKVLILGGTGEARVIARAAKRLGYDVTTSLAGRTHGAARVAGRVRRGGFGGAKGLARHLKATKPTWLIDATHPFAVRISSAAGRAARATGTKLLRLARPTWSAGPGDRWHFAADAGEAARMAAGMGRVFLTIGRHGLAAFDGLKCVVRAIEPFVAPIAGATLILGRGPFKPADEARIMRDHAIGVLVTKASGGAATRAKLDAARTLGLPVILIQRPDTAEPGLELDAIVSALKRSNSRRRHARLRP